MFFCFANLTVLRSVFPTYYVLSASCVARKILHFVVLVFFTDQVFSIGVFDLFLFSGFHSKQVAHR